MSQERFKEMITGLLISSKADDLPQDNSNELPQKSQPTCFTTAPILYTVALSQSASLQRDCSRGWPSKSKNFLDLSIMSKLPVEQGKPLVLPKFRKVGILYQERHQRENKMAIQEQQYSCFQCHVSTTIILINSKKLPQIKHVLENPILCSGKKHVKPD